MLSTNVLCMKKRKKRSYCVSNVSDYRGKYRDKRGSSGVTMMHITEDTPPDMLAGAMDLTVQLPNSRLVKMSVERSTPMMDVLVQITTAHHLQLSGYVIEAMGMTSTSEHSDKVLPYKPNTPIGTLDTRHVRVVPKTRTLPTHRNPAPGYQPFESTFRLKVHLPRKQLFVSRVSMNVLLEDVMRKVCDEKNLDPIKYEFRHPDNLDEVLDPKLTLSDYQITEIYVVSKGSSRLSQAFSASDIMALRKDEERTKQGKSSGGVFNLIFKRGKTSNGSGSVSSENRSISPTHSDDSRSLTPPAVQQQIIKEEKPKVPLRKRRPAPKPPQIKEEPSKKTEAGLTICHSRNSSDSSGYHEASVLSDNVNTTLPRRPQTMVDGPLSGEHSRSTGNLASMSPHSKSTSSLAFTGRKKKAPPPPPVPRPSSNVEASPVVASPVEKQGKSLYRSLKLKRRFSGGGLDVNAEPEVRFYHKFHDSLTRKWSRKFENSFDVDATKSLPNMSKRLEGTYRSFKEDEMHSKAEYFSKSYSFSSFRDGSCKDQPNKGTFLRKMSRRLSRKGSEEVEERRAPRTLSLDAADDRKVWCAGDVEPSTPGSLGTPDLQQTILVKDQTGKRSLDAGKFEAQTTMCGSGSNPKVKNVGSTPPGYQGRPVLKTTSVKDQIRTSSGSGTVKVCGSALSSKGDLVPRSSTDHTQTLGTLGACRSVPLTDQTLTSAEGRAAHLRRCDSVLKDLSQQTIPAEDQSQTASCSGTALKEILPSTDQPQTPSVSEGACKPAASKKCDQTVPLKDQMKKHGFPTSKELPSSKCDPALQEDLQQTIPSKDFTQKLIVSGTDSPPKKCNPAWKEDLHNTKPLKGHTKLVGSSSSMDYIIPTEDLQQTIPLNCHNQAPGENCRSATSEDQIKAPGVSGAERICRSAISENQTNALGAAGTEGVYRSAHSGNFEPVYKKDLPPLKNYTQASGANIVCRPPSSQDQTKAAKFSVAGGVCRSAISEDQTKASDAAEAEKVYNSGKCDPALKKDLQPLKDHTQTLGVSGAKGVCQPATSEDETEVQGVFGTKGILKKKLHHTIPSKDHTKSGFRTKGTALSSHCVPVIKNDLLHTTLSTPATEEICRSTPSTLSFPVVMKDLQPSMDHIVTPDVSRAGEACRPAPGHSKVDSLQRHQGNKKSKHDPQVSSSGSHDHRALPSSALAPKARCASQTSGLESGLVLKEKRSSSLVGQSRSAFLGVPRKQNFASQYKIPLAGLSKECYTAIDPRLSFATQATEEDRSRQTRSNSLGAPEGQCLGVGDGYQLCQSTSVDLSNVPVMTQTLNGRPFKAVKLAQSSEQFDVDKICLAPVPSPTRASNVLDSPEIKDNAEIKGMQARPYSLGASGDTSLKALGSLKSGVAGMTQALDVPGSQTRSYSLSAAKVEELTLNNVERFGLVSNVIGNKKSFERQTRSYSVGASEEVDLQKLSEDAKPTSVGRHRSTSGDKGVCPVGENTDVSTSVPKMLDDVPRPRIVDLKQASSFRGVEEPLNQKKAIFASVPSVLDVERVGFGTQNRFTSSNPPKVIDYRPQVSSSNLNQRGIVAASVPALLDPRQAQEDNKFSLSIFANRTGADENFDLEYNDDCLSSPQSNNGGDVPRIFDLKKASDLQEVHQNLDSKTSYEMQRDETKSGQKDKSRFQFFRRFSLKKSPSSSLQVEDGNLEVVDGIEKVKLNLQRKIEEVAKLNSKQKAWMEKTSKVPEDDRASEGKLSATAETKFRFFRTLSLRKNRKSDDVERPSLNLDGDKSNDETSNSGSVGGGQKSERIFGGKNTKQGRGKDDLKNKKKNMGSTFYIQAPEAHGLQTDKVKDLELKRSTMRLKAMDPKQLKRKSEKTGEGKTSTCSAIHAIEGKENLGAVLDIEDVEVHVSPTKVERQGLDIRGSNDKRKFRKFKGSPGKQERINPDNETVVCKLESNDGVVTKVHRFSFKKSSSAKQGKDAASTASIVETESKCSASFPNQADEGKDVANLSQKVSSDCKTNVALKETTIRSRFSLKRGSADKKPKNSDFGNSAKNSSKCVTSVAAEDVVKDATLRNTEPDTKESKRRSRFSFKRETADQKPEQGNSAASKTGDDAAVKTRFRFKREGVQPKLEHTRSEDVFRKERAGLDHTGIIVNLDKERTKFSFKRKPADGSKTGTKQRNGDKCKNEGGERNEVRRLIKQFSFGKKTPTPSISAPMPCGELGRINAVPLEELRSGLPSKSFKDSQLDEPKFMAENCKDQIETKDGAEWNEQDDVELYRTILAIPKRPCKDVIGSSLDDLKPAVTSRRLESDLSDVQSAGFNDKVLKTSRSPAIFKGGALLEVIGSSLDDLKPVVTLKRLESRVDAVQSNKVLKSSKSLDLLSSRCGPSTKSSVQMFELHPASEGYLTEDSCDFAQLHSLDSVLGGLSEEAIEAFTTKAVCCSPVHSISGVYNSSKRLVDSAQVLCQSSKGPADDSSKQLRPTASNDIEETCQCSAGAQAKTCKMCSESVRGYSADQKSKGSGRIRYDLETLKAIGARCSSNRRPKKDKAKPRQGGRGFLERCRRQARQAVSRLSFKEKPAEPMREDCRKAGFFRKAQHEPAMTQKHQVVRRFRTRQVAPQSEGFRASKIIDASLLPYVDDSSSDDDSCYVLRVSPMTSLRTSAGKDGNPCLASPQADNSLMTGQKVHLSLSNSEARIPSCDAGQREVHNEKHQKVVGAFKTTPSKITSSKTTPTKTTPTKTTPTKTTPSIKAEVPQQRVVGVDRNKVMDDASKTTPLRKAEVALANARDQVAKKSSSNVVQQKMDAKGHHVDKSGYRAAPSSNKGAPLGSTHVGKPRHSASETDLKHHLILHGSSDEVVWRTLTKPSSVHQISSISEQEQCEAFKSKKQGWRLSKKQDPDKPKKRLCRFGQGKVDQPIKTKEANCIDMTQPSRKRCFNKIIRKPPSMRKYSSDTHVDETARIGEKLKNHQRVHRHPIQTDSTQMLHAEPENFSLSDEEVPPTSITTVATIETSTHPSILSLIVPKSTSACQV